MPAETTPSATPARRLLQRSRLLFLLTLILTLAACTTAPPAPSPPAGGDVADLRHWRVEGKLGYRSPDKNGSAFVRWSQQDAGFHLQLNGPFGAGATVIQGDDNYAVLSQSGRDDLFAASGEELSTQLFGWPFPVKAMTYWIRGLAAPSPTTRQMDDNGLLATLEQDGWRLAFSQYRREGSLTLPGRISGSNGPYAFTLVINRWTTIPTPAP